VPRDRPSVRSPDTDCVSAEPLVAHGAKILRVRVEHVLAADVAGRVEEGESHPHRDLEQAPLLPVGLMDEPGVDRSELLGAGQALGIAAKVGERPLEGFHLERGDVDEPRRRPACAFERSEQVVHRGQLGVVREDACCLELADERVEVDARPTRHVGGGREQPERREAEGEDRAELDHVPRALADRQLLR